MNVTRVLIDEYVRSAIEPHAIDVTSTTTMPLDQLVRTNVKVEAIKHIRDGAKCGLFEAKLIFEGALRVIGERLAAGEFAMPLTRSHRAVMEQYAVIIQQLAA